MKRDKHSGKILDGRYELIRLLDEGGMGAVYFGKHIKLGRKAAVKFLHSELTANEGTVKRFYREAQAASAISHPNIIDVFDVGVAEWGEPYLVMEYLSGENLGSLLKRKGIIPLAAALGIMEPALHALAAAHEHGIVHRDLKPENIFVVRIQDGPPIVKLIDFGISKFVEIDQPRLTKTGALLGTPSYMSPEQARGKGDFDHRADLYSMGVILYLMLTGDHPFVGQSYNDLIITILTEPPREPSLVNPNFPKEAEPIIKRLLEKEPEKRYPDCQTLLSALEKLEDFAFRQEALIELTSDIQPDSFATGDLGTGRALSNEPDDLAATVFAKMGSGDTAGLHHEKKFSSTEETKSLSWDMIPSEIPPPHVREKQRRSPWLTFFVLLLLFGAGAAVVLGLDLLYPLDMTAADNAVKKDRTSSKTVASQDTAASSTMDIHTATALTPSPSDLNDGSDNAPADSEGKTNMGLSVNGASGSLPQEQQAAPSPKGPGPVTAVPEIPQPPSIQNPKSNLLSGSQNQKQSSSVSPQAPLQNDKSSVSSQPAVSTQPEASLPKNPPVDEEVADNGDMPPNPLNADFQTLTPQKVDRLVDSKSSRIQNCYDMARISDPTLQGRLVLIVGIGGDTVQVSVQKNELSPYLASCVTRVISSLVPPPNDGTMVEIQKEFEFKTFD